MNRWTMMRMGLIVCAAWFVAGGIHIGNPGGSGNPNKAIGLHGDVGYRIERRGTMNNDQFTIYAEGGREPLVTATAVPWTAPVQNYPTLIDEFGADFSRLLYLKGFALPLDGGDEFKLVTPYRHVFKVHRGAALKSHLDVSALLQKILYSMAYTTNLHLRISSPSGTKMVSLKLGWHEGAAYFYNPEECSTPTCASAIHIDSAEAASVGLAFIDFEQISTHPPHPGYIPLPVERRYNAISDICLMDGTLAAILRRAGVPPPSPGPAGGVCFRSIPRTVTCLVPTGGDVGLIEQMGFEYFAASSGEPHNFFRVRASEEVKIGELTLTLIPNDD